MALKVGHDCLLHRQIASFLGGFFMPVKTWRVRTLAGSSRARKLETAPEQSDGDPQGEGKA